MHTTLERKSFGLVSYKRSYFALDVPALHPPVLNDIKKPGKLAHFETMRESLLGVFTLGSYSRFLKSGITKAQKDACLEIDEEDNGFFHYLTRNLGGVAIVQNGAEAKAKFFVEYGIACGLKVDSVDSQGRTPLHHAAASSDTILVEAFLNAGANIEAKDRQDATPLLYASTYEVSQLLKKRGANISHTDQKGRGVLHYAVVNESQDIVEWVIRKRLLSVDQQDCQGRTALHYALTYYPSMAGILKNNANFEVKDKYGKTPLHTSVLFANDQERGDVAFGWGGDVNTQDNSGATLLHTAASVSVGAVQAVLDNTRIDINALDKTHRTPLDCANHSPLKDAKATNAIRELLSERGALSREELCNTRNRLSP